MCYFICQTQNITTFVQFKPDLLFLVKSKMVAEMAIIVGDITGFQLHYQP